MAKFITAQEAAKLIPDNATVGFAGMGLSGFAEGVVCAIRDNFKETGHPCGLNIKQGSALGDWGYGNGFVGWNRSKRAEGPVTDQGVRGTQDLAKPAPDSLRSGPAPTSVLHSLSATWQEQTSLKATACPRASS